MPVNHRMYQTDSHLIEHICIKLYKLWQWLYFKKMSESVSESLSNIDFGQSTFWWSVSDLKTRGVMLFLSTTAKWFCIFVSNFTDLCFSPFFVLQVIGRNESRDIDRLFLNRLLCLKHYLYLKGISVMIYSLSTSSRSIRASFCLTQECW